jgi:hypothetical protein
MLSDNIQLTEKEREVLAAIAIRGPVPGYDMHLGGKKERRGREGEVKKAVVSSSHWETTVRPKLTALGLIGPINLKGRPVGQPNHHYKIRKEKRQLYALTLKGFIYCLERGMIKPEQAYEIRVRHKITAPWHQLSKQSGDLSNFIELMDSIESLMPSVLYNLFKEVVLDEQFSIIKFYFSLGRAAGWTLNFQDFVAGSLIILARMILLALGQIPEYASKYLQGDRLYLPDGKYIDGYSQLGREHETLMDVTHRFNALFFLEKAPPFSTIIQDLCKHIKIIDDKIIWVENPEAAQPVPERKATTPPEVPSTKNMSFLAKKKKRGG